MRLLATVIVLLACAHPCTAQRYTVSGIVRDAGSGETLIGANVHAVSFDSGTTTNDYGFYSLTLPRSDSATFAFTFVGYAPQVKKVYLTRDVRLDVELEPTSVALGEVTVVADASADRHVRDTQMSVVDVPVRFIEKLPSILGEQDVLKLLQLLPGVQPGQEGTTGYHVRGGTIDQNLVELDEAVVYNPNHLFGLFSTFNTDALSSVELVKGGFPAQFGGRLSSVLRVKMREGNRRDFAGRAGIGLMSSSLTMEGPIAKDRASFLVSGRRSYIDLLIRPWQKDRIYYFYDLNAKINYQSGPDDRIYLSGFTGRDDAEYVDASGLGYGIRFGNTTGTLRWNHIFGSTLFANLSLIGNRYFIRVNTVQGQFYSQKYSGVEDVTAKIDFEYYPTPRHTVQFGGQVTRHVFKSTGTGGRLPGGQTPSPIDDSGIPERTGTEFAVFVQDDWEVVRGVTVLAGMRVPFYTVRDTTFGALEPRLSLRVSTGSTSSVKASYTMMNQYVHLVPSTTASLPTDIWTPASRNALPQESTQWALGYFKSLREGEYEASLEGYYKDMRNQTLFREGAGLLAFEEIDSQLTFGHGWSYGAELFIRRRTGRLSGWVSYTLSWTNQRFAELNRGEAFPFRYDRRHNLAAVGIFRLNDRWSLSANLVVLSGPTYTLPIGRLYASLGGELYQGLFYDYDTVNNYRMAPYHRLDVAATLKVHPRFFKEGELVLGAYNVYSRLNPYFVYLDLDTDTQEPVARQVSLLPIIPSIAYRVRF